MTHQQIQIQLSNPLPEIAPAADPSTGLPALKANLTPEERRERFKYAFSLGLPDVAQIPKHKLGKIASVWGGGYSIERTLPDLRKRMKVHKGIRTFALNKTHDWLASKGLKPNFGVLADPRPWIADYMTPLPGVDYLFSSKIEPRIFERFKKAGASVYLWHAVESIDGQSDADYLAKHYSNHWRTLVFGYSTIGLRVIDMLSHIGPPRIELNGYDGSYDHDADKMYPYDKPNSFCGIQQIDRNDMTIKSGARSFRFLSNTMMRRQVEEWKALMGDLLDKVERGRIAPIELYVAGTGAIPWMAWNAGHHLTPDRMAALYGDEAHIDWRPKSYIETEKKEAQRPAQITVQPFGRPKPISIPAMLSGMTDDEIILKLSGDEKSLSMEHLG